MITATEYNCISLLDESLNVEEIDLRPIARVFKKYRLDEQFGIAKLHRHFSLHDDEVMVHHKEQDHDICRPCRRCQLYPHSYFVHPQSGLIAFEFANYNTPRLPPLFLEEIGSLFRMMGVDHLISIIPLEGIDASYCILSETLIPDKRAMRSVLELRDDDEEIVKRQDVVGWQFKTDAEGNFSLDAFKKCTATEKGPHYVT